MQLCMLIFVFRKLIFMFGAGTSLAERCGSTVHSVDVLETSGIKMCILKSLQLFILVSTISVESVVVKR